MSTPLFDQSSTGIFADQLHFKLGTDEQRNNSIDHLLGKSQNRIFKVGSLLGSRESLQLCTEELGFESSYDSAACESGGDLGGSCEKSGGGGSGRSCGRSRMARGFPPPISCIGSSGKPSIVFRSFKGEGRFVLREVRVPTKELLHACREDGRLKLHLVQSNMEEEEDDEDDDGGGEEEEGGEGRE